MPVTPKPNFDDLCLAMARFLNCLDRAEADALEDLYNHVSLKRGPDGRFDSLRWGAPPKIVPLVGDERAELIPPRPEGAPQVPVPMAAEKRRCATPKLTPVSRR